MRNQTTFNRRDFLKVSGASAAVVSSGVWSELSAAESNSPNEKLNIACVGTANRAAADINGVKRTYFCGAYWRHGFHEDGVVSALNAVAHFREKNGEQQLPLQRAS